MQGWVVGERSGFETRYLRVGVVIALVLALSALGGAQPASAEDDYVRYTSASFYPTDAVGQNPDKSCLASVYIAETTNQYIEAYGEIRCSSGRVSLQTDLRITNSPSSFNWLRRDKDVCTSPSSSCRVESSAITGLRATPGRQYCFQFYAYSRAMIPKSGYRTSCFIAA